MGCGKSSVGRRLSELLCCPFMDLDHVIEERTGRTIPEIFATDGESAFRAMELDTLKEIVYLPMYSSGPLRNLLPQAVRCKGPLDHLLTAHDLCGQRGSTVSGTSPDHHHQEANQQDTTKSTYNNKRASLVLALGGGAVMTAECAEIVHSDTLCIYLRASVETLMEHLSGQTDNRPLLRGDEASERVSTLLAQRSSTYENTAHIIIDTDGRSIDEIARELGKHVAEQL